MKVDRQKKYLTTTNTAGTTKFIKKRGFLRINSKAGAAGE